MTSIAFSPAFARLAASGQSEETVELGGVSLRLVRVAGGGEGRWDRHDGTAETVLVWSGDFLVEFRDGSLSLKSGECCVVPRGADHRGTSRGGAEIVLMQTLG